MRKNVFIEYAFLFFFAATIFIFLIIINILRIPNLEGQKYGSVVLEMKLKKLIELEKSKGIDAIFFGVSTVDFGISAKTFSEEVSKATGKKFTAFNFGMGGGEHYLWADFIKIIELHSKPKIYFLQNTLGFMGKIDGFPREGLHEKLSNSPIGSFINIKVILMVVDSIWDFIKMSSFPNIRNKIVFDKYAINTSSYPMNEYGDSISYNYLYLNQDSNLVNVAKSNFIRAATGVIINLPIAKDTKEYNYYFKSGEMDYSLDIGYRRLIYRVDSLNSDVYIAPIPMISIESSFEENELFKLMNRKYSFFFQELCKILNIKYLSSLEDYRLKTWQIQDETHYNTYAAEEISRILAGKFLNKKLPDLPDPNIDALYEIEKETRMKKWTSIIRSPDSLENNVLKLKYIQNENTYNLSNLKKFHLIIRLEKNSSRIFELEKTDEKSFNVRIPMKLLKTNAMYAIDLLTDQNLSLGVPLDSYKWENQ